jgi:hypothetical protein
MRHDPEPGPIDAVAQGFDAICAIIPLSAILPVRAVSNPVRASHKYKQIAASVGEIGLVEPPVVVRDARDPRLYLLLDGHIRIEILRDLGISEVECLIARDDEAFTYNKRINRLSAVQEQRMIAKAIERHVPKEKIAKALAINVRSVARKLQLLDGICGEVAALLKDKFCPMAVFDILRKMRPLRQIEAAELMINANNYAVSYASAILTATPQSELVDAKTTKRLIGMTAEAIARMETELARLQAGTTSIQDSYGQDHLHLTVAKGYLSKLIANERIARYLAQHHSELLGEFRKIAEMTSSLPNQAA